MRRIKNLLEQTPIQTVGTNLVSLPQSDFSLVGVIKEVDTQKNHLVVNFLVVGTRMYGQ